MGRKIRVHDEGESLLKEIKDKEDYKPLARLPLPEGGFTSIPAIAIAKPVRWAADVGQIDSTTLAFANAYNVSSSDV